jgi:hypothetical protein
VDAALLAKTHERDEHLAGIAPSEWVVRIAQDKSADFGAGFLGLQ